MRTSASEKLLSRVPTHSTFQLPPPLISCKSNLRHFPSGGKKRKFARTRQVVQYSKWITSIGRYVLNFETVMFCGYGWPHCVLPSSFQISSEMRLEQKHTSTIINSKGHFSEEAVSTRWEASVEREREKKPKSLAIFRKMKSSTDAGVFLLGEKNNKQSRFQSEAISR